MCVIIYNPPGTIVPIEKFQTAAHNNPHGYGLVINKDGKLHVEKALTYDVKELYQKLCDNQDYPRYLHLRWATVGEIDESNLHPFTILDTPKRQLMFMHNGTLNDYKPKQDEDSKRSDTRKYAEEVLTPLLKHYVGPRGRGDITMPIIQELIKKTFDYNSKGCIISNDIGTFFLHNNWSTFVIKKGEEIIHEDGTKTVHPDINWHASNNQYFDKVTRGPEYDRLKKIEEEERKAKAEEERLKRENWRAPHGTGGTGRSVVQYGGGQSQVNRYHHGVVPLEFVTKRRDERQTIIDSLDTIFSSHEIWSDEGLEDLGLLTNDEIETFMTKNKVEFASVFGILTDRFSAILQENEVLSERHAKASKRIEQYVQKFGKIDDEKVGEDVEA